MQQQIRFLFAFAQRTLVEVMQCDILKKLFTITMAWRCGASAPHGELRGC